jgi:hypothetical protein
MRGQYTRRFMHEQNMDKDDFTPCVHDIKFTAKTLKETVPAAGISRPLQGMGKTTAKRPRPKQEEPPDAA